MCQDKDGTMSQRVRGRGDVQRLHSRLGFLKTQVRTTVFLKILSSWGVEVGRGTENGSGLAWCDKDGDKTFYNPFLSGNCVVMEAKEFMFQPQDYPDKAG